MSAQRDRRVYVLQRFIAGSEVSMSVHSSHQKACSASPYPDKPTWQPLGDVVFLHPDSVKDTYDGNYYKITKARIR